MGTRIEKDSLGELAIPNDVLYGIQTERARQNFPMSDLRLPSAFISALAVIKSACATANRDLKLLEPSLAEAIIEAADTVFAGQYHEQFPLDVFQTGSGTSSNMNANEVIAHLASQKHGITIHPNDHVNMSQSSNDVIPTAIHLSAALATQQQLLPALQDLFTEIERKGAALKSVTKMGRTHLMDALPITFGQELSGWATQIKQGIERINHTLPRIYELALGGTAVGTGLNADPEFATRAIQVLAERTHLPLKKQDNYFAGMSAQDNIVELSGQFRVLAVSLTKISNDLRWMNSGPLAGLADISLPAVQPGSSIMPGKVNPVIPEAIAAACVQVMGNDVVIGIGGASGNFQLNTMLPMIAYNILHSIQLLTNSARILSEKAIRGFTVNEAHIQAQLAKNPILVTALNPLIGYEKGAEIAKRAYQEKRSVLDVAKEMTTLSEDELARLLDPRKLTEGGIIT